MSDIRKRNGRTGTTYQVRYRSAAKPGSYSYVSFKTRKEAKAFLESGTVARRAGLQKSPIKTVDQAIDAWLHACEHLGRDDRPPVSSATLENYQWRARTMKAFRWEALLQDVTETDVRAFRSWLKETCPADKARKVLFSFRSVMIEMVDQNIIPSNPAAKIRLKGDAERRDPVSIPSVDEFLTILRTADRLAGSSNPVTARTWERYRPMIYLAADSGLRPQEYLALPISALGEKGVTVTQALNRDGKVGSPKSAAGHRYIPISDEVMAMVRDYADRCGKNGFVFPTRQGGACQQYRNFMRNGFHVLMREAGMVSSEFDADGNETVDYRYTPYSLRHFYASMLIDQNMSTKRIQTRMGHEDITTTYNVYGHLIQRKEEQREEEQGGVVRMVSPNSCGEYVAKTGLVAGKPHGPVAQPDRASAF